MISDKKKQTESLPILLVEDNAINQVVAKQILSKSGFTIDIASSGREALTRLSEKRYGLVLMDVQMPEMDGMETTKRIRDEDSPILDHTITVIAMTAYTSKEDQQQCLAAGMDDFISKPLEMDAFIKKVKEHYHKNKTSDVGMDKVSVFDEEDFSTRLGDDRELEREILADFLVNLGERTETLKRALENEEGKEAYHAAQLLQGACGNISAISLRNLCLEIEKRVKDEGEFDDKESWISQLENEAEKLRKKLEAKSS